MFQENRSKLLKQLGENAIGSVIVLQGGPSPTRFDTDHEPVFRQESYFWWLTGVKEPDCAVVIHGSGITSLFIPKLPADYAIVMGRIKTCEEWKELYEVDHVHYVDDLESYLLEAAAQKILVLHGPNTDSGNDYNMAPKFAATNLQSLVDITTLFPILAECRVLKSPKELTLLEHVAQISSFAHAYVMRNAQPGMMEYQCESLFKHYAYFNYGSRLVSYTSICGCGPNAAILHYGHSGEPNSRQLSEEDNCLFDMGAEYQCYASDITCSFPANGIFSEKYRPIYMAVLNAQIAVYNLAKPGVSWVDCHKAAEAEILKGLSEIGVVVMGDATIPELVERRLGAVFMPHGLGHFLGIDTHDVGGYLPGHPSRSPLPGLAKLRTARILQETMVLTVEPGCYFIDHLIDGAKINPSLNPYLNFSKLEEYRGYGGCRLEDVVTITKEGVVNFTLCPRTPEEIEHVMAGGKWPPIDDKAPELLRKRLTSPIAPLLPSPPSN